MKQLVIHAGLPKNGSSALQVFFSKNRENLLKEGVDYFPVGGFSQGKQGLISSGNGGLFARSLLPESHEAYYDAPELYSELESMIEASSSAIGLLSSEFFANVSFDRIGKLKSKLDEVGVRLKFVYYVRRQDQFLMSSYMQRVKRHGYTGSPDEYVLNNYRKSRFLNYYGFTKQLENVLGVGNVSPHIYESTRASDKGLVGHFLRVLISKCPEWVINDEVINTSPSPLEVKLMLTANMYSPRMRFSDFLIEDSITSGRSSKYGAHAIVSPETVDTVLQYFSEQNQQFEREYGMGAEFPATVTKEFIDLTKLTFSPNELMDVISGLLVRMDRRVARLEKKISS